MDLLRIGKEQRDNLGVSRLAGEGSRGPDDRADALGGEALFPIDSSIFEADGPHAVPSYKAGATVSLPYSASSLPHQSSFGSFSWKHTPTVSRCSVEGDLPSLFGETRQGQSGLPSGTVNTAQHALDPSSAFRRFDLKGERGLSPSSSFVSPPRPPSVANVKPNGGDQVVWSLLSTNLAPFRLGHRPLKPSVNTRIQSRSEEPETGRSKPETRAAVSDWDTLWT